MTLRALRERAAAGTMRALTLFSALTLLLLVVGLAAKSWPILRLASLRALLFSSDWQPLRATFGFASFILGTLWVASLAMLVVVPVSILVALYLSEYAGARLRRAVLPAVDLLAGIPSVVFGLCGVVVVVPFVRDVLAPVAGATTSGYCVLSGSIVLAVMVFPIVINLSIEVLQSVPVELREAALALGSTRWETTRHVVLRRAGPGVATAVVLGFARALGETMAVLMVVGNVPAAPASVFDPAYPLPALLANNYGEMMSVPLYDSALMFGALLLLAVVVAFNLASRLIVRRLGTGAVR